MCVCVFPSVGLNHEPTCCQWSMQQNLMECLQWFNDRNLIDLVVKEMRCWRSVLARSVSMEQTHRKAANRYLHVFGIRARPLKKHFMEISVQVPPEVRRLMGSEDCCSGRNGQESQHLPVPTQKTLPSHAYMPWCEDRKSGSVKSKNARMACLIPAVKASLQNLFCKSFRAVDLRYQAAGNTH